MGFWSWLLKALSEELPEEGGSSRDRDRYKPGGVDRFMGKDMGQVKDRFGSSFGNHYDDEEERD